MNGLAASIERDGHDLATIEAVDAGILFRESKALLIMQAVDTLRYFAKLTDGISETVEIPGRFGHNQREPYAVCAAIVPWNAQVLIMIWTLALAIASENVLIIKTARVGTSVHPDAGQLIVEASFPSGVIKHICGLDQEAGKAVAEHMLMRKLSLTGIGATGRSI